MKNSALSDIKPKRERIANYIKRGAGVYLSSDRDFGGSFVSFVVVSEDSKTAKIFIEFRGEHLPNVLLSKVRADTRHLIEKIKDQYSSRFFPKLYIEKSNEETDV